MNFQAAEQAKANLENLENLFDKICETASVETQERLINRINEVREEVRTHSARTIRTWSDELASLNID